MTHHQHDRSLQRQAREIARRVGVNYTTALRQLERRYRGGLLGPLHDAADIVAAAGHLADLGDNGMFDDKRSEILAPDQLGRVSLPCRGFSGRVRSRESDAGVDR